MGIGDRANGGGGGGGDGMEKEATDKSEKHHRSAAPRHGQVTREKEREGEGEWSERDLGFDPSRSAWVSPQC